MPIIIANAIRTLIIFLVQSAASLGIIALLEPLLDAAKKAVKSEFDLAEGDANTYVANMLLDIIELAGVSILVFKSRLPLKLADKLGFSNRGFTRGALPPKVSSGPKSPGAAARSAGKAAKVPTVAEASVLISALKNGAAGVRNVLSFLEKRLQVVFLGFLVAGGWLDFANWETGAYSQGMQKVLETVTFGMVKPDEDWRKSKTASDDVFGKIHKTYQLSGAVAINDPFKRQSVPFTRDNLIDLIDQLGAKSLLATGSASTKALLAASQTMIVFDRATVIGLASGVSGAVSGPSTGSGSGAGTYSGSSTTPKVFSGIVSQGVVQPGLVFTSRPDDMIESLGELREAAANNLASYLAALPGKIVYEVKVVNSVISKDGFTQRGTTQRIQNGAYQNGTPKYKTVTNKFAVLYTYALTDKGTRTKLASIVLGPTDSAKLLVNQDDLRVLETALPKLVTTQDLSEVTNIKTSDTRTEATPDTVKEVEKETYTNALGVPALYTEVTENPDGSVYIVWRGGRKNLVQDNGTYFPDSPDFLKIVRDRGVVGYEYVEGKAKKKKAAPAPDAAPVVSDPVVASERPGVGAATLFEWYQAQGSALPSVAERSVIYQDLGLGQASYYAGTAEQNTKLLEALKAK